MENLKLNLEEGSTSVWGSALHYQSAITMRFREVVDDRHAGILLKVNEVSLAFPQVKSAANFNERHCSKESLGIKQPSKLPVARTAS